MWTNLFIITTLLLIFCILRQLILISTAVELLSKDAAVMKKRGVEETEYLFIKGLY